MERRDFAYELPGELIAQEPLADRTASRMLCLDRSTGRVEDRGVLDLPDRVRPGDLVVLNDTRVLPARLYGRKHSGGRVEVLVERVLDARRALVHLRASRAPRPGAHLRLAEAFDAEVVARHEGLFELRFEPGTTVVERLEAHGHVPLPPYIRRPDRETDRARYQTVFARAPGAAAAPTAGLHLDEALLGRLAARGAERAFVTLHVGAGTFQPVRAERVEDHRMHPEHTRVSPEVCARVRATRERGGRIVAVGTTVVRALESAARDGDIEPFEGETRLFIYPGYRFSVVDAVLTNFHLPESSLLMMVCAFGGYDPVMSAYRHAVQERYRFFSYGDAMYIE